VNDITCRSRIINILGSTEPVGIVEVGTNGIVTVKAAHVTLIVSLVVRVVKTQYAIAKITKMTLLGNHALNQNAQFLQIVYLVVILMTVFSNVFVNSKQSTRTVHVRRTVHTVVRVKITTVMIMASLTTK